MKQGEKDTETRGNAIKPVVRVVKYRRYLTP